jgi:hypothetical protein
VNAMPTEAEKYRILAELHGTSTNDINSKQKTINALSLDPSTTPTDEEKLNILQSLKSQQ